MKNINSKDYQLKNIFLILLSLIILGGCATGTTKLKINHNELNEASTKREGNLLLKTFVDLRENTEFIGNKRNGFGMVLGHVGLQGDENLETIMTRFFAETLQENGYKVTIDSGPSDKNISQQNFDAIIEGSILEFWMDLYMAVWHKVKVDIKVLNPNNEQVLWKKEISGAEKRVLWVGATGEYERIVREALTKTLNTALEEFTSDDFYNSIH